MSILVNSIEQFICEDKNASQTNEYLGERYQLSTLGQTIYRLFMVIKKCISQYYFYVYKLEKSVETNNWEMSLLIDCHKNWVIGMIDIKSKNIRLELVHERSTEIFKKCYLSYRI